MAYNKALYRFNRRTKKINEPQQLSLPFQRIIAYTTIAGTALSLFFAWYAIKLTKQISEQSTKIEKMDSLLHKQDTLISSIAQLIKLQDNQISQLAILDSQVVKLIQFTNTQTNSYTKTTEPIVIYSNVSFDSVEHNLYLYKIFLRNYGGRTAEEVQSKVYFFVENKENQYMKLKEFNPQIPLSTSIIQPGKDVMHFTFINASAGVYKNAYKEAIVVIKLKYKDPLTGKTIRPKPFYFRHTSEANKLGINTVYLEKSVELNISKLIIDKF